jgi:hypothetical protein
MKTTISTVLLGAAFTIAISTSVLAASFESLVADGYKVGKMSRSASGASGWVLSGKDGKYFCKLDASMALGKTTIYSLITGGRVIELDRKTFEQSASTDGMPLMSDLKAGKPRPQDVGSCSKSK